MILLLPLFAQSPVSFSESPIITTTQERFSQLVYVKFNKRIIDLPPGISKAQISNIETAYPAIRLYFQQLEGIYNGLELYKAIPRAQWGAVKSVNKRTGKPVKLIDMSQLFIIRFSDFVPIDQLIFELEQLTEVEYAHGPIQAILFTDPSPNDPRYQNDEQWNLEKINAPNTWDITTGDPSIIVGIIDSDGIWRNHPDFENSDGSSQFIIDEGDDTYSGPHGTAMTGLVAAATDNNEGIAALGWNIKMIPYHWTGFDPPNNNVGNLPGKIDSAITKVDVLSLSFGTIRRCLQSCTRFANYPSVSQAIQNALAQGVIIFAATGNRNLHYLGGPPCEGDPDCDQFPFDAYPALDPGVIGVSATNYDDNHPANYNFGLLLVDVAAPGIDVVSTSTVSPFYEITSGTSNSTPQVAALAGLMLSIKANLSSQQV